MKPPLWLHHRVISLQLLYLTLMCAALSSTKDNCDCFLIGSSLYFENHRFFDFRSLLSFSEPANVTNPTSKGKEHAQSDYFSSATFINDWTIATWGHTATASHPVMQQNSKQNMWIAIDDDRQGNTSHLSLRTYRNTQQSSTAEISTNETGLLYASIRAYARIRGDSGAVAGIFTYYNDSQESDIEVLTREEPRLVHFTNQPGTDPKGHTVKEASTVADLTTDRSNWIEYRVDWLPNISQWYLNGARSANLSYAVPQTPSSLVLNMWSNGGNWSGNMAVGSAAYLDVQWVELFYNKSSSQKGLRACKRMCTTGDNQQAGNPTVLSHSTGLALPGALEFVMILLAVTILTV